MCSCHTILECCVMFSGVKLSMGSSVLFKCPGLFVLALASHFRDNIHDHQMAVELLQEDSFKRSKQSFEDYLKLILSIVQEGL